LQSLALSLLNDALVTQFPLCIIVYKAPEKLVISRLFWSTNTITEPTRQRCSWVYIPSILLLPPPFSLKPILLPLPYLYTYNLNYTHFYVWSLLTTSTTVKMSSQESPPSSSFPSLKCTELTTDPYLCSTPLLSSRLSQVTLLYPRLDHRQLPAGHELAGSLTIC
jgi:hypothetical protein